MIFKNKILCIIIVFILNTFLAKSQTVTATQIYNQYMPNMPLTPSAASLFKSEEIGLNEYNGSAKINIPLLQLSQIPIDLSYIATSGNRVTDQSGIVGLGWDINIGGIVQNINDIDDLQPLYFYYDKMRPDFQGYVYPSDYPLSCAFNTGTLNCTNQGTLYPKVAEIPITIGNKITFGGGTIYDGVFTQTNDLLTNGNFDSEPDVFNANFLGHSLKFINDFSSTSNTINFKVLNKVGYKIVLTYVSMDEIKFIITAPNGTVYEFSALEKIKNESSVPSVTTNVDSRTWKLTKIIEPNKRETVIDYIDLQNVSNIPSYTQEFTKSKVLSKEHFSYQPFDQVTLDYYGESQISFPDYNFIPPEGSNGEYTKTFYNGSKQNIKLINSITSDEGKLSFYYSDRIDFPSSKKLDSLILYNSKNQINKRVKFDYSYFNSVLLTNVFTQYQGNISPETNFYRLKLNSILINDRKYDFLYNSQNLPVKNSFAMDFWGYYNGSNQNTSLIPNPIQFKYYSYIGNNGNNLNSDEIFAKASILEKIIYPTRGSTKFEYELNEATNLFYTIQDESQIKLRGNGLRIKKITNFDSNDSIINGRSYEYFGGRTMIPLLTAKTNSYYNTANHPSSTGFLYYVKVDRLSSNNYFNVSPNGISNYVGYDRVKITDISGSDNNGFTEKIFQNRSENVVYLDNVKSMNNYSFSNDNISNGSILSESFYNSENVKVKEFLFDYYKLRSQIDYGAKVSFYGLFVYYNIDGSISTLPRHQISFYPIYGQETLLKKKVEKEYFFNNNITTEIDYSYNENRLVNRITKSNDDGEFYNENVNYSLFYQKNILTLPSSKIITSNNRIKETVEYFYDEVSGIILPTTISKYPMGNGIYKKSTYFDIYDSVGNLIEFHSENGVHTVYIWGYNRTFPIAKIENATYDDVQSYVANLQILSDTGTEADLLSALANLRNSLPNAMVTTYTYKPLVGLSTSTDPKGYTTYYEYDSFNRLKQVKDQYGKVLSANEYHYKNQQ